MSGRARGNEYVFFDRYMEFEDFFLGSGSVFDL